MSEELDLLIEGCKRGKRDCQERLYKQFAKDMYALCLSYTKDKEAAQDILQEGFLKVFKKIGSYHYSGSFEGWIRRTIINTAIDHLRKEKRISNYIEYSNSEIFADSHSIYQKLNLDQILSYIQRLPDGARTILNLFAIEGYSHKEISEKLSISVGTSKSQYNRARNLLKEMIWKSEEEGK